MAINTNPYSPGPSQSDVVRRRFYLSAIVPLIGFTYPVWALGFVALTWFMDRVLGMHGAIIHSYETPLGVVFNIAAKLTMNCFVLMPAGLFLSAFVGVAIRRPRLTIVFPLSYLGMCAGAIAFVLFDPTGLFVYFFD